MEENKKEIWEKALLEGCLSGTLFKRTGVQYHPMVAFIKKIIAQDRENQKKTIRDSVVQKFNGIEAYYGNPRTEKMIYYDDALEILDLPSLSLTQEE